MFIHIQTIATLISVALVDKAGRRMLLIISYLVMTLSYAPIAFYFNIKDNGLLCTQLIGSTGLHFYNVKRGSSNFYRHQNG